MLGEFPRHDDLKIQSEAAMFEAEHLTLSDEIYKGREKVRGLTIDRSNLIKVLDNAIWLRKENGLNIIDISISDVASVIKPGSALYKEALRKGETAYKLSGNDPMLPVILSEDKLSLLEGHKRPTVTVSIPILPSFEPGIPTISKTFIESQKRLTHKEVNNAFRNTQDPYHEMLKTAGILALNLIKRRRVISDVDPRLQITEDGNLETIRTGGRNIPNLMIQEFMILANQLVATYCAEKGVPILFRNNIAKNIAPERKRIAKDINQLLSDKEISRIPTLARRLGMILKPSNYGTVPERHFALNVGAYAPITSPIRRVADLVNWGQILASLDGESLPYNLEELDDIAKHLNNAEKEIKVDYVEEHLRQVVKAVEKGEFKNRSGFRWLPVSWRYALMKEKVPSLNPSTSLIEEPVSKDSSTKTDNAKEKVMSEMQGRRNNIIDTLYEFQAKNRDISAKLPPYSLSYSFNFPPSILGWECICTVRGTDDKLHTYTAYGPSKKDAKQKAAEKAIYELFKLE